MSNITELTCKIRCEVEENIEDIFIKTITDVCGSRDCNIVYEMKKDDIIKAITNSHAEKMDIITSNGIHIERCPVCCHNLSNDYRGLKECYCKYCGKKLLRGW